MINVGDKVHFIDDDISGVVLKIEGDKLLLESEDGFEITCDKNEVIKRGEFDDAMSGYLDNRTMDRILSEKSQNKRPKSTKRESRRDDYLIEVDLHIERILRNYKHMSSGDILDYQLHRAKIMLEKSIKSNQRGLIFIHGHGDGVLRAELTSLFKRYNCTFYDADYVKYGGGATEVIFN